MRVSLENGIEAQNTRTGSKMQRECTTALFPIAEYYEKPITHDNVIVPLDVGLRLMRIAVPRELIPYLIAKCLTSPQENVPLIKKPVSHL